jgi:hypothetical protein
MSFFGGGTSHLPKKGPQTLGLDASNSSTHQEARPLPWLFGRQRLSVTFESDVFDIKSVSVNTGGKTGTSSGSNYYASFSAVCCLGPVKGLHDFYLNGDPVFVSTDKFKAVSVKQTANTAVFQTKTAHGFDDGQAVVIFGAKQAEFNGEFHVQVLSDTQFAYTIFGSAQTPDKATGNIYVRAKLDPIFADGADSTDITLPDYGVVTIQWGTETQTEDAYLNANSGARFPANRGVCRLIFHQLFLGFNQKSVQNIEVVLEVLPAPAWMNPDSVNVNGDANPCGIIYELVANPRHGLSWNDSEIDLDAFSAAADVLAAEKLGLSRVINKQDDASTLILSICETIGALPVEDEQGRFSIVLLRQPADVSGIPVIGPEHCEDVPEVEPVDWQSTRSDVQLVYKNRDRFFNDDMAEWKDLASVNAIGRPEPLQLDRPWVSQSGLADAMVTAAGSAASVPTVSGTVKLIYTDALFTSLTRGALFTFSDDRLANGGLFRVLGRSITDSAKPEFTIEFEADRSYLFVGNVPAEPAEPNLVGAPALDDIPGNSRFAVLELPPALCSGRPALALLPARDAFTTSSAEILIGKNYDWSGDPTESFFSMTKLTQFAWHGTLTDDYPANTQCIDLRRGIFVQLDGPDLILDETTPFDALASDTLALIGNELLSVISAQLIATGLYQLKVIRGRYATPIVSHSADDQVIIFRRSAIVPILHPQFEQPGNVVRWKLLLGLEEAAEADAYDVGIRGLAWSVPPPAVLTVNDRWQNAWYRSRIRINWAAPDPGGALPRSDAGSALPRADAVQQFTKIEFIKDDAVFATRSTVAGFLSVKWDEISADPPSAFTVRAGTVVNIGLQDISGPTTELPVLYRP